RRHLHHGRVDGARLTGPAATKQAAATDGYGQGGGQEQARNGGAGCGGGGGHSGSNSVGVSRPNRYRTGLMSRRSLIRRRSRTRPRSSLRVGPSCDRPSLAKVLMAARFSLRIASAPSAAESSLARVLSRRAFTCG